MRLALHAYLLCCLGAIAVVPVLLLGATRAQRLEEITVADYQQETGLAAEALAREAAQLMQAHTDAVEGLANQVEAARTPDPVALQPIVTAHHRAADTLGNMWVANAAGVSLAVDP